MKTRLGALDDEASSLLEEKARLEFELKDTDWKIEKVMKNRLHDLSSDIDQKSIEWTEMYQKCEKSVNVTRHLFDKQADIAEQISREARNLQHHIQSANELYGQIEEKRIEWTRISEYQKAQTPMIQDQGQLDIPLLAVKFSFARILGTQRNQ
ncbi:Sodium- and chloride-dependent transporter XTRP3 [Perkinsela sp. CCAP 1560/4]|nr:Sodium- and chloride-dependent transporter XTRP3 [Perkinsela sp. CCAP 1560/4]|eukprot:KNH04239.1 Sodium- and chloride-dependent transporter XTRP3 [Perkinsela sp. CCAP 1560/4]